VPAHALAGAEKARAEHVVGAAAGDGLEHAGEAGRVVLAVPVDVDGRGIALVTGDLEAGPKRGAEPARDRMRMNPRAVLAPDVRGGVRGAVVDEQDVHGEPACFRRESTEDTPERRLLIARHHDRKAAMKTSLDRSCPA
jgi:hypothetical protein